MKTYFTNSYLNKVSKSLLIFCLVFAMYFNASAQLTFTEDFENETTPSGTVSHTFSESGMSFLTNLTFEISALNYGYGASPNYIYVKNTTSGVPTSAAIAITAGKPAFKINSFAAYIASNIFGTTPTDGTVTFTATLLGGGTASANIYIPSLGTVTPPLTRDPNFVVDGLSFTGTALDGVLITTLTVQTSAAVQFIELDHISFTVDNTAPNVTLGTINSCYPDLEAAEAAALEATSASDNFVGTLTETASTVGTCSAVVTVTTTDLSGNATAVTYNTRIDNTAPTVTAGTIASCYPTIVAAEAAALAATSATDNCPGALTELASTVGTCSAVITVTTTDGCGNATAITYNTKIDNTPPSLTCPANVTVCGAAAVPVADINSVMGLTDNCPGTITVTHQGDASIPSPTAPYNITRTYRATDACGNFTDCTQIITVNPVPTASASNSPSTICTGNTFSLGSTGGSTYAWSGPNSFTSTAQNPTINNATTAMSGTYTVTVTRFGCVSTATTSLTVNSQLIPNATITDTGTSLCIGSSSTLSAPNNPNYTYAWFRSLSGIEGQFTPFGGTAASQTVTTSGVYKVEVTEGICKNSDTTAVKFGDYYFTGSLGAGDAQQTGRMNRFAVVSTCASPKSYQGTFTTTGLRYYDSYSISNPTNSPMCATIGMSSGCGSSFFCATYLDSFNPAGIGTNYLSDPGSSFPNTAFYEATIPANATLVVVVHELNPGLGCASYNLRIEIPLLNISTVTGNMVSPTYIGRANQHIVSTGKLLAPASKVDFIAPNSITLNPGFETVGISSYFKAQVGPNTGCVNN